MEAPTQKRGRPRRTDDENKSAWLSAIRVTKAVRSKVIKAAARAGFGKNVAEFRLECYLKIPPEPVDGMMVDDVLKNLSDLTRMRKHAVNNPELSELIDRITQRHMDVIKPKT